MHIKFALIKLVIDLKQFFCLHLTTPQIDFILKYELDKLELGRVLAVFK